MNKIIGAFIICIAIAVFGRAISLDDAKKKNPEINELLKKSSGEIKSWVEFLLEYMPTMDLVSLNADSMLAELSALDSVLDLIPWAKDVPEDYFYYYVLPYRVGQEPLEYFRKNHWKELWERVSNCETMECATYRLNEWCYEEMKYEPTSRWDQTAEQTLVRGIGRCEEMAILFIKACRTMGIPIRDAYSPYWPFTNSNHAWVEVWTGDAWHFVGGAEMTALDNAWFNKASRRTAIIKGIAWSELDTADVPIYYAKNGFTILNLTPLYSDTTGLSITVLDENSAPVESADVWISVFNYSSLRTVAHHYTDKNGNAHFVLGKAELFVSAGNDSIWDFDILPLIDGNSHFDMQLILEQKSIPDTSFWLKVVKEVHAEKDTSYKPPDISYCRHKLKQERLTAINENVLECLPDSLNETRFIKCINRARGNRDNLLAFWLAHQKEKENIISLWEAMADKDILIPDSSQWEQIWEQTMQIRERFVKFFGNEIDDSIFWKYTANPRILWEDFDNWYPDIWKKTKKYYGSELNEMVNSVSEYVQQLDTLTDKSYFGGMMNPIQVVKAGTGRNIERLGVFVAMMRTMGIPTRISWDYDAAEFFDIEMKDWKRFELRPEKEDEKKRNTGIVRAIFRDIQPKTEMEYYKDFTINKIEKGAFEDLTPPKEIVDSFVIFKDIPEGDYAFMTGWRNAYGSPFVRIKPFTVSQETTEVEITVGLPPVEMVSPGDLIAHKFDGIPQTDIRDTKGKKLKEKDWNSGTVVIAIFDTEHESSISTAKVLANVPEIPMIIFVVDENADGAKQFCKNNGLAGRIFYGDKAKIKESIKFKQIPSIMLLKDGKAIMWTEGLNLDVDKLIQQLL
ncbi:hypothetical protein DRQ33_00940 [bacterium]|nr:MAG: hypothetical protein DRQ33_00940 [bacterium]